MMNNAGPLLSIVIPTRNRFCYVTFAIKSVLEISSPLLQLVVEDNSDTDELSIWLEKNISDPRLVYHYSSVRTSMSDNYDRAMSLVTGEYVFLIGDDDGVTEEIIAAAQWAKVNGYDALVPKSIINYVWPDLSMGSRGALKAGELRILPFTGTKTFPEPEIELLKCVRDAGQDFHKLPKAYCGIVKKQCFDQVKAKTGTYFPGVSPDMAATLAVANFTKRICEVDYPLFIQGSSAKSNAGLGGLNRHIGKLRDQPHLPSNCEANWSEIVPCFYSVQTVWAEAAVSSLRAMGREDVLKAFNVPKLFALCCIFHWQYVKIGSFYRALKTIPSNSAVGTLQLIYYISSWWWLRVWRFILRKLKRSSLDLTYRKSGLASIAAAVKTVNTYLEKREKPFN